MTQITTEEILELDDTRYCLLKSSNANLANYYEIKQGYTNLNYRATNAFRRNIIDTPLIKAHKHVVNNNVPEPLCDTLISEYDKDKEALKDPAVLKSLLPYILTQEVDDHLRSYFKSEYCVFWWAMHKLEDDIEKKLIFQSGIVMEVLKII
ncbi:hypothetical protein P4S67_06360 [Pseudoalteromonas sp. B137]